MKKAKKIISFLTLLTMLSFSFLSASPALAVSYITLDNFSGPATNINVSGGGWTPGETVSIYIHNTTGSAVATAVADPGSFFGPINLNIPANTEEGPLPIIAVGSINHEQRENNYYVISFTPTINLTGNNTPGSSLSIDGTNFAPNETVVFSLNGNNMGQTIADTDGNFLAASAVIPNVTPATYVLHATGQNSGADAIDYFYVGGFYAGITPSTYYLLPTQTLNFSGWGYAANETVKVLLDNNPVPLTSITADQTGSFTTAGDITIPINLIGKHTFHLTGDFSHASAATDITVGEFIPNITPSTYFILPGDTLTFSGGGFAVNESVSIYEGMNTTALTTFTVDANGDFVNAGTTTIPFDWTGSSRNFKLVGSLGGGTGSIAITVGEFNSLVSPSLYHLFAGSQITFSGTGFAPHEIINITEGLNLTILASISADTNGSFNNDGGLIIPFNWANSSRTFNFKGISSHTEAQVIITVAKFTPLVNPSGYYLLPGSEITFSGTGFGPLENISLNEETNNNILSTVSADVNGNFLNSSTFNIPFDWTGVKKLVFTGLASNTSTSLDITVAAFNPQLTPSTYYVLPGQNVTIAGSGFAPEELISVSMNGSPPLTAMTSSTGAFEQVSFTAPFSGGPLHFVATGQKSGVTSILDISLGGLYPFVDPSTWYTSAGSKVTFTGSGFASNEIVNILMNGTTVTTTLADNLGSFNSEPITIPFGTNLGNFSFVGTSSGAKSDIAITIAAINPGIVLSTYYAIGGTPLTITGMGFGGSENVSLIFGGFPLGSSLTDNNGNFSFDSTVPYLPAGNKIVQAIGLESGGTSQATFIEPPVYVDVQLGSYAGAPGTNINFIGNGYISGETINVTTNRTGETVIHNFNADISGNFNNSLYTVPLDFTGGPLILTIVGEHSLSPVSIVYYITGA